MKETTRELIKAESRRDSFGFIAEVIQRGRMRPKKYKHDITLPAFLFEEVKNKGIIDTEDYFINETAFFEFDGTDVTVSFMCLFACEDLHRKIDHYLVMKFAGSYPIRRGGRFF